ncbi:MAG: type II toxin-antitoxin system PemK/MazF family toxin [bacterium]
MVAQKDVPTPGAVYTVSLDPTLGHEERGARPVFVVSPKKYNAKSGLALVCPITSKQKGYPFEVVCSTPKVRGVILVDQVRALDWKARKFVYVCDVESVVAQEVRAKLLVLVN